MNILTKFIHATSYVTIIPMARLLPASSVNEESLNGLAVYLPAVGLLIGSILAATCLTLETLHTANFLLATLITILWLTLTGGLHFDGLMDTADGIFSHRSKERMLEIMQDSRVGNFAVMVGVAAFALKIAALTALPARALPLFYSSPPALPAWLKPLLSVPFPMLEPKAKAKFGTIPCDFPKMFSWQQFCL